MSDLRPDIWRLQANSDTQGLIDALGNSEASIRRRAAAALAVLDATMAVSALRSVLASERDADTREALVAALAVLEPDEMTMDTEPVGASNDDHLERWIDQLGDAASDAVIEAAHKLAASQDKRASEALVLVFNDLAQPPEVRLAVAEALLELESAPVEVTLLKALRGSTWRVRRNGAAILGQMRATWAVQPLSEALRDENEVVRRTAIAALRRLGTPEARAVLGKLRTSELRTLDDEKPTRPVDPPLPHARRTSQSDPRKERLSGLVTSLARQGNNLEGTRPSKPKTNRGPMPDVKTERLDHKPDDMLDGLAKPFTPEDAQEAARLLRRQMEDTQVSQRPPRRDDEAKRTRATRPLRWPKRDKPPSYSVMPTKPLDPKRAEEAQRRISQQEQDKKRDDPDE